MQNFLTQTILPWLINPGLKIILLVIGVYIAHRFIDVLIAKSIRKLIPSNRFEDKEEEIQREDTLISVATVTLHVVIWIVGGMMVLSTVGVNIAPLIAVAGLGGLAFGFGAQHLVRDVINGLFILLENQYGIGDWVCFDKICGMVENINLRRTILRDSDGVVHTIPNSAITIASNHSDQYAKINLNIGVGYDSNIEKVIEVVNSVGQELAQDPLWEKLIIKTPEFKRVNDFADSAIIIRISGETKPLQNWAVTGELRKRLKIAFDKEGIEIPFNQLVIHKAKTQDA